MSCSRRAWRASTSTTRRPRRRTSLQGKIPSVQSFPTATGLGLLEAARGSEHLTDGTTVLSGEVDVTGAPWDGRTWRDADWNGRTWRGRRVERTHLARPTGGADAPGAAEGWSGRTWKGSGWMAAEFVPTGPLS